MQIKCLADAGAEGPQFLLENGCGEEVFVALRHGAGHDPGPVFRGEAHGADINESPLITLSQVLILPDGVEPVVIVIGEAFRIQIVPPVVGGAGAENPALNQAEQAAVELLFQIGAGFQPDPEFLAAAPQLQCRGILRDAVRNAGDGADQIDPGRSGSLGGQFQESFGILIQSPVQSGETVLQHADPVLGSERIVLGFQLQCVGPDADVHLMGPGDVFGHLAAPQESLGVGIFRGNPGDGVKRFIAGGGHGSIPAEQNVPAQNPDGTAVPGLTGIDGSAFQVHMGGAFAAFGVEEMDFGVSGYQQNSTSAGESQRLRVCTKVQGQRFPINGAGHQLLEGAVGPDGKIPVPPGGEGQGFVSFPEHAAGFGGEEAGQFRAVIADDVAFHHGVTAVETTYGLGGEGHFLQ